MCDKCGATFTTKSNLRVHQRSLHATEPKFKCDECGESFRTEFKRLRHTKTRHTNRPFPCDTCSAAFLTRPYLLVHQRVHTGARSFSCTECEKTYKHQTGFQRHMVSAHQKFRSVRLLSVLFSGLSSLRNICFWFAFSSAYSCPKCPNKFFASNHVRRHLERVHKITERIEIPRERKYPNITRFQLSQMKLSDYFLPFSNPRSQRAGKSTETTTSSSGTKIWKNCLWPLWGKCSDEGLSPSSQNTLNGYPMSNLWKGENWIWLVQLIFSFVPCKYKLRTFISIRRDSLRSLQWKRIKPKPTIQRAPMRVPIQGVMRDSKRKGSWMPTSYSSIPLRLHTDTLAGNAGISTYTRAGWWDTSIQSILMRNYFHASSATVFFILQIISNGMSNIFCSHSILLLSSELRVKQLQFGLLVVLIGI